MLMKFSFVRTQSWKDALKAFQLSQFDSQCFMLDILFCFMKNDQSAAGRGL